MIIEDDAATLEYVYDLLTMHSYKVSRWMTSMHALEQVIQRQPDLVMLDHRLDRNSSGWLLLLRMRTLPETVHIPVILYSAEHDVLRVHRDEIRSMHGDVLEKPFIPEQVLAKIEALTNTCRGYFAHP